MVLAILLLFSALAISAIAAYFSIAGLVAIFPAAPIPIMIMGGALELAKLVAASWTYRNWKNASATIKGYFTVAVIILSLITSMGIFGYLSKAHIEQAAVSGSNDILLQNLEQRETIVKQKIDFILSQSNKTTKISKRLQWDLTQAQKELNKIVQEKIPLQQSKNKFEAELGPLKYITEFIYGKAETQLIDKAVRWVIITIIFVFDPLAIIMIIAFNSTLVRNKSIKNRKRYFKLDGKKHVAIDTSRIHIMGKET